MARAWPTLAAHLRLARPADNLFAWVGTLLGAGLSGASMSWWPIVMVACSNALLSAGSMMINDWHGVAEDAVNRPDRPIPSGAVPRGRALAMALTTFAAGGALAALADWRFGVAALAVTGLSVLYTMKLKSVPALGNGVIGLLSAYPLWCWCLLGGFEGRAYLGAAAGFFVAGTGREMIRTGGDATGDAARGIRTVATCWGASAANRFGLALVVAGYVVGVFTALGSTLLWYLTALSLATPVLLGLGIWALVVDSPPGASRRLTVMARRLTVLFAVAVASDLIIGGWGPR